MAYSQKIVNLIGGDAWEKFKLEAREYFAKATGHELTDAGRKHNDDPEFDWDDAATEGAVNAQRPFISWAPFDGQSEKPSVAVTMQWLGEKLVRIIEATDTGFIEAATNRWNEPVDTGFKNFPGEGAIDRTGRPVPAIPEGGMEAALNDPFNRDYAERDSNAGTGLGTRHTASAARVAAEAQSDPLLASRAKDAGPDGYAIGQNPSAAEQLEGQLLAHPDSGLSRDGSVKALREMEANRAKSPEQHGEPVRPADIDPAKPVGTVNPNPLLSDK